MPATKLASLLLAGATMPAQVQVGVDLGAGDLRRTITADERLTR